MKKIFFLNPASIAVALVFLVTSVLVTSCNPDSDPSSLTITCTDIDNETVWADRGDEVADYILDCEITLNAKLTIEPGVVILCGSGSGITIGNSGTLVASGTSEKPIILKSDSDIPGVWKGLYFKSNDVLNELNYCQILNAGSGSFDGNTTKVANIRVALDAKVKITNSTISKSGKDGILVDGFDSDELNPISVFSSNVFENNQNYPISAIGTLGNVMDGTGSTFTGNVHNKVLMRGGRLVGNHTWQKLNVPYLVQDILSAGYYSSDGNLTIEPGTVIEFAADAGICSGDYATGSWLKIIGTSTERITLTGETAAPGAWKGIAFQSLSSNNQISYADISYGGSSSFTGNTSQVGNIRAGAWSAGSFTIDNATVSNSAAYGIYVTMPSPTIIVPGSVIYSGNASGDYFQE